MIFYLVLIYGIAGAYSFPQNHGYEGNFGYDPFGGTFQHLPVNLQYVPPVEYPSLPPAEEGDHDAYVPLVEGKPIYIPETFHDGFVFRDMTYSDPQEPLPEVQGDQGAHFNPQQSIKVEPVKNVKSYPSKKRRPHSKGHIGARSSKYNIHKKPVAHKEYDAPVVVQAVSKMTKPIVHKPTYDYQTIKTFLDEDHDFSKYFEQHEVPDVIEKGSIEGFTKTKNHEKPIKNKHTPKKPVYPVYKKHDSADVEPLTKKEKPIKNSHVPAKKPIQPVYEGNDYIDKKESTKKEKPKTAAKPIHKVVESEQETPIFEAFSNKGKSHHEKPVEVKDESESTVTGEAFIELSDHDDDDYDTPVVVEALTKKKPVNHEKGKPIHVVKKDEQVLVDDKYLQVTVTSNPVKIVKTENKRPNHGLEYSDESPVIEAFTKKDKYSVHEKHEHKKAGHDRHDNDRGYDIHVEGKPDSHVKISGKNIDDDLEYDYDFPEVIGALSKKETPHHKGEKPIKSHPTKDKDEKHTVKPGKPTKHIPVKKADKDNDDYHKKDDHIKTDQTNVTDKDDVEVEYEWTDKKKEKNENPKEKGHIKPDLINLTDKDDVEVEYEWTDEDKDYELDEDESLEPRELEGSEVEDEILSKDVDEFVDGSGSVNERIDRPEGKSFLPVDPNVWSLMSNLQNQERHKFKSCFTPKNESGNCMPIQMCAVPNFASSIDELVSNVCVIDEVFIGICCPEFPVETIQVDWDQFVEGNKSDTFNEETSKECGKLPAVDDKTIAWPWMAPLVAASTGKVFCGGALISEQYVLSAAHCTTKIPHNRILIRLGSLETDKASDEDFEVVEIKRHAQYNPRTMANDIALLKLSRKVSLGEFRGLICLPEDDDDYVGETSILLGWKGFSEKMDDLESLRVISKEDCQNKMGGMVTNSFVCTQPRVEQIKCNGDSGAPLVVGKDKQFKIIGVLTWNRNDCDTRLPSIFTRVSKYSKWIKRHTS